MRVYMPILLLAALTTHSHAQPQTPLATYTLHPAEQVKKQAGLVDETTVSAMTPSGALLVLLPQSGGQWQLKQLTAWQSKAPDERTIPFRTEQPDKQTNVFSRISVSPDNRFAFVRVTAVHLKVGFDDEYRLVSTILVVNLGDFTTVSSSVTNDRLLQGEWRFSKEGILISDAVSTRLSGTGKAHTHTLELATLSVPALSHSEPCYYNTSLTRDQITGKFNTASSEVAGDCTGQLKTAGVSTIAEWRDIFYRSTKFPAPPSPSCRQVDLSQDNQFVLEVCGKYHNTSSDGMFDYTTSKAVKILSVITGKDVLTLHLPFYDGRHRELLATVSDQNYLLRLIDDVKVEIYIVPKP